VALGPIETKAGCAFREKTIGVGSFFQKHELTPITWEKPDWHPDHGDTKAEFEHLRRLAEAVLSSISQSTAELIVPEPGLMYLRIERSDGAIVAAYSLGEAKEMENRRYGLFLSPGASQEQEFYADSVAEAVGVLA